MRFLVLAVILALGFGCSQQPGKSSAPLQDAPISAQSATLTVDGKEVSEFFERWNAFQVNVLSGNVAALERAYLELKKNPPKDPKTGKPLEARPGMVMYSGAGWLSRRSMSPAVNTFERHLDGAGDGLIGYIPEEAARLRVWVADRDVTAAWHLYSLAALEKERSYSTFRDTIGARGLSREADQQMLSAAKDAVVGKVNPLDFGRNGTYIETKPMIYDSPSCITCHPNKKLGDLAGIMVYGVWDKSQATFQAKTQRIMGSAPMAQSTKPRRSGLKGYPNLLK